MASDAVVWPQLQRVNTKVIGPVVVLWGVPWSPWAWIPGGGVYGSNCEGHCFPETGKPTKKKQMSIA